MIPLSPLGEVKSSSALSRGDYRAAIDFHSSFQFDDKSKHVVHALYPHVVHKTCANRMIIIFYFARRVRNNHANRMNRA